MDLSGMDKINRQLLIDTLKQRMVVKNDGITCSGGEQTTTYLDVPGAMRDAHALRLGVQVLRAHLYYNVTQDWTMIGGPTTGAIPLVTGVALQHWDDDVQWFIVRDKVKEHGLGRMFVGGEPGPGDKVIVTDDVVSTGNSLLEACERIMATGAEVLAVVPLVDRGEKAWATLSPILAPYLPVLTYADLGLEPLGVK